LHGQYDRRSKENRQQIDAAASWILSSDAVGGHDRKQEAEGFHLIADEYEQRISNIDRHCHSI
jgi:hypothetical protein